MKNRETKTLSPGYIYIPSICSTQPDAIYPDPLEDAQSLQSLSQVPTLYHQLQ